MTGKDIDIDDLDLLADMWPEAVQKLYADLKKHPKGSESREELRRAIMSHPEFIVWWNRVNRLLGGKED